MVIKSPVPSKCIWMKVAQSEKIAIGVDDCVAAGQCQSDENFITHFEITFFFRIA